MRDALSILDQAIAYNQEKIEVDKVNQMLGTLSDEILINLLIAIADQDGEKLISLTLEMNEKNISFESSLEGLASLIYELSLAKLVPSYFEESSKKQILEQLLDKFTPEKLQLLYQIATIGKRDLYLAPDLLAGFNMTLLRMLAFYPAFNASRKETESASIAKEVISPKEQAVPNNSEGEKTFEFDGNWRELVEKLELGMAKSLARRPSFGQTGVLVRAGRSHQKPHLLQNGTAGKQRELLEQEFC